LHRFDTAHECDRQTDRRTDGQTPRRWQRRAKHFAFARKNQRRRASKTANPLKSGYFTAIGSRSVKTVADKHRHTAYRTKQ